MADRYFRPFQAYNRKRAFKPDKHHILVFTLCFLAAQFDTLCKSFIHASIQKAESKMEPGKMNGNSFFQVFLCQPWVCLNIIVFMEFRPGHCLIRSSDENKG